MSVNIKVTGGLNIEWGQIDRRVKCVFIQICKSKDDKACKHDNVFRRLIFNQIKNSISSLMQRYSSMKSNGISLWHTRGGGGGG